MKDTFKTKSAMSKAADICTELKNDNRDFKRKVRDWVKIWDTGNKQDEKAKKRALTLKDITDVCPKGTEKVRYTKNKNIKSSDWKYHVSVEIGNIDKETITVNEIHVSYEKEGEEKKVRVHWSLPSGKFTKVDNTQREENWMREFAFKKASEVAESLGLELKEPPSGEGATAGAAATGNGGGGGGGGNSGGGGGGGNNTGAKKD